MPFARDRISLAVSGWRTWGILFSVTNRHHSEAASYLGFHWQPKRSEATELVLIFETLLLFRSLLNFWVDG